MFYIPLLADFLAYNTRIPLLGTWLLGMCGGAVGTFMLLRKKALVSDVASHSALPGICIAYLVVEAYSPGNGKSLSWLLIGASVSAACGVLITNLIQRTRLIKEDAALGIVLSLFFGAGVVLLTIIQPMNTGNAAGLNDFIFGKPAAITLSDVYLIAIASGVVLVVCYSHFKEFAVLCFDEEYASAVGWPARRLDLLLTSLVVGVTVIGMQSVGLLLVVALLVIPPTAARFWSNRLAPMVMISSAIGGFSAVFGVLLSASSNNLATGPMIVLSGTCVFALSLLFGLKQGTVWQWQRHRIAGQRKGQLDLLRAFYEELERTLSTDTQSNLSGLGGDGSSTGNSRFADGSGQHDAVPFKPIGDPSRLPDLTPYPISLDTLIAARSWSVGRVMTLLRSAVMEGWLRQDSVGMYRLTQTGTRLAARAVRNHRLWELYLIHFADVSLSRVDREADLIEHVLEPGIIAQLETLLRQDRSLSIPQSPHG